jgi:hypothetical protein
MSIIYPWDNPDRKRKKIQVEMKNPRTRYAGEASTFLDPQFLV